MSHSMVDHKHKKASQMDSIPEDLIRLSIGIEKREDIIDISKDLGLLVR